MNEKVQKIMEKIDQVTEYCNFLPKLLDKSNELVKKPVFACIPGIVNKLTSKFSIVAIVLFSLVYSVYCLKNMVICMTYKHAPVWLCFGMAIASLIAMLLSVYIVYKTTGIFDKIIASSPCRISSLNFFEIMTFINRFLAVAALLGGIYAMFEFKSFSMLIYGIIGAVFFFLISLYNSTVEEFAIIQDKNASAGEDFTAICTFCIKVVLRLVPILIFVLPIIGICTCFPEIFESYTISYGDTNHLMTDAMVMSMLLMGLFLLVGFIPLIAYLYYLSSYVVLDLIRAVLSLPQKLDDLKK